MSGNIDISIGGQDSLSPLLAKVDKAIGKTSKSLGSTASAAGKLGSEYASMGRLAKRAFEETRTPLERHNSKLRELKRLMDANLISQDTFSRGIQKSGRELNRFTDSGTRRLGKFRNMLSGVAQTMSSMSGLAIGGGVAGLVTAGVTAYQAERRTRARLDEASEHAALESGEAVRRTRVNFQADKSLKDAELEPELQRIAEATRTKLPIVAAAASDAFSAKGDLPNRAALEAVEQALRVLPNDLANAVTMSGRTLDVAKASGSTNIRAIGGQLIQTQGASRVTDLEKLGGTAVQAINSVVQAGGTAEQGSELFATLTQLTGDTEGRKSATGISNLMKKLDDFAPTTKGKDKGGEFDVPQRAIDAFNAAADPMARLSALQSNPNLGRQFLGTNTFEAFVNAPMQSLIRGDRSAMNQLRAAQGSISPIGDETANVFERKIASLDNAPFQGSLTTNQRVAQIVEAQQLERSKTREGSARNVLRQMLEANETPGLDFADTTLLGFDQSRGTGTPEERAIRQIRKRQRVLRKQPIFADSKVGRELERSADEAAATNPVFAGAQALVTGGRPSADRLEQAEALEGYIEALQESLERNKWKPIDTTNQRADETPKEVRDQTNVPKEVRDQTNVLGAKLDTLNANLTGFMQGMSNGGVRAEVLPPPLMPTTLIGQS